MLAAGKFMKILLPFIKEDGVKIIRALDHADLGHNLGIKEIIFKGIIF